MALTKIDDRGLKTPIDLLDNEKIRFGTGNDLEIYHSGSHSNIKDAGTGQLNFWSNTFQFYNAAGNKTSMKIVEDAQVELYHDNSKKFETTSAGVTVTGTVSDSKGDLRKIIQNTQGSAYSLVASDAGKHILASGDITVPNSVFSAGDAVTIVNNTSGDITLYMNITTRYSAADGSTVSNFTLASRGVATLLFASGTVCYGSGAGLS